jgi:oligosaccharyltransferase complex subunit delta (ribophorin II)
MLFLRSYLVTRMSLSESSDFYLQDVGSKASEFGYLSGLYSMELIVGDAVLSNSFSWKVADVVLRFSDTVPAPGPTKDQYLYAPKPEIKVCIF